MRKAISLVILAAWTACGAAQPGGGQNPPAAPAPQAAPATTVPGPNRRPAGAMKIGGRLIANGRLPQPSAVRLDSQSGQQVGYAYVGEGGDFEFPALNLDPFQLYNLVAEVEGFKPVRQTLNIGRETVFAPRITIFLEPADSDDDNKVGSVISVKELTVKIPDKSIDEYKKARKESAEGNYSKAVEHLERALKLAPDYYDARNSLGAQYMRLQRFRDAEKAFAQAQNLSPEADEPLINLGSLYFQEGQFQKSVGFLQEAIRKNPQSVTAYQYLGAALYKTGSYDQAEPMLRRALELDSGLTEAEFTLLNVYTRQSRYTEALQQIDSFLKRNPKSTQRGALEKLRQQIETALKPD